MDNKCISIIGGKLMIKVEDKLMHDFSMNVKWMDNIVL
jgi:hypothetical protein